jgi:hypothetical protein
MLTTPLVPGLPSKLLLCLQRKHRTTSTAEGGDTDPVKKAALSEGVTGFEEVLDFRHVG